MTSIRRPWLPLSLVAIAALTFGAFALARPASAAVTSLSIVPADSTVEPGGSVTVALVAEATDPGIDSATIDVTFDNSLLDATACTETTATGATGTCNADFDVDAARFTFVNVAGSTGTVEIGTLTLEPLAGVTTGTSDLTFTLVEITEGLEPSTPGAVNDGTVTIAQATPTPTATPAAPTPTATAAAPTPTATQPAQLPVTGGSPSNGNSGLVLIALIGAVALATAAALGAGYRLTRPR